MILDIIILLILILPMALGLHRGFIYTFVHALGWIGALVAAFFLTDPLAGVLRDSFLGNAVSDTIAGEIYGYADSAMSVTDGLPDIISGGLTVTTMETADILVAMITGMILSVLSFLIVIIVIRLILRVVVQPVARRERGNLLSKGDKYLGLVAGALKGVIFVFLFLTLLVPVINLSQGGLSSFLANSLDSSFIAGIHRLANAKVRGYLLLRQVTVHAKISQSSEIHK